MLRVSSRVQDKEVDLARVRGEGEGDGGVEHGQKLVAFVEAVMRDEPAAIATCRSALESEIGPAGIVDTAAVIAMFNVVDRIADATGIPLDQASADFRESLGSELGMAHLRPEARI